MAVLGHDATPTSGNRATTSADATQRRIIRSLKFFHPGRPALAPQILCPGDGQGAFLQRPGLFGLAQVAQDLGEVAQVATAGWSGPSALLREHLLRVITDEPHRSLVVNLAQVSFIDSTGTGVLVGIWHRVRATNAGLALAAPSRPARAILDITGLLLPVYDMQEQAVPACRPPVG